MMRAFFHSIILEQLELTSEDIFCAANPHLLIYTIASEVILPGNHLGVSPQNEHDAFGIAL